MAEACRFANSHSESKVFSNQDDTFNVFHVFCVFLSLVTLLADITTNLIVFAEYCKNSNLYWASATVTFIVIPNILINIFSLRWITADKKSEIKHWITHCSLVGLIERYITFLREATSCKNQDLVMAHSLSSQRNDLSLLHFLYTFTGSVPQMILQSYAIVILDGNYNTKVFALTASIASVAWSCATYIYSITSSDSEHPQWHSVSLKLVWHFGMLIARIAGLLLFTIVFGIWTLVPLGLHWAAMTFWIVTQKTTFCPNKLEETFYNVVMGFVYCFCYINLREGHTRYRLMMFYTLMVTQNFGSLFLYVLIAELDKQRRVWSVIATVCIVIGTIIGMCGMIFYYRWFHEKGPIMWKNIHDDIELNNKTTNSQNSGNKTNLGLSHVRSFKSQKDPVPAISTKNESNTSDKTQPPDVEVADKKFLLDHLIARSGTPTFMSAPIGNSNSDVSSIQFHTVENTPQINKKESDEMDTYGFSICPNKLNTKLSALESIESSIDDITKSNLNINKRRGICSSDELRDDLANMDLDVCNINSTAYLASHKNEGSSEISQETDGSNKKTSSDSIDMDLDLSFSDINSSDINNFNENIVQKLCLSALKNIKVGNQDADIENIQRIAVDILKEMYAKKGKTKTAQTTELLSSKQRDVETPTELLSVHDYENICAVNIAREAWGLRSWNGYSDIENWLHDGSVVRDRRRDTLTSGSSEISSCMSQELKNSILSAPPFPKRAHTYSNVFVKTIQADYVNAVICHSNNDETFLAKPCVTDVKDPNHLEPIIEELDDLGDIDPPNKKRLNSESSLVATIDEIRKTTVTNSPRNMYHRHDHVWDSPQFSTSAKIESNLKKALWKEPSKFNSNNIMESFPEKENMLDVFNRPKLCVHKNELNIPLTSCALAVHNPELNTTAVKSTKRRPKSNNLKTQTKKLNNKPEEPHDLSNRDIDFLWKLVSETAVPTSSAEDLSTNHITSSLQSLILKDVPPTSSTKNSNIKKNARSKPRRKFSILRERFEPRTSRNSDEEILYRYSEKTPQTTETSVVNVKNVLDHDNLNSTLPSFHSHMERSTLQNSNVHDLMTSKTLKEKRSLFMKQVLSPPKFNTKLKHKV